MRQRLSVIVMGVLAMILVSACGGSPNDASSDDANAPASVVANLPDGDPERGAAIFNGEAEGVTACTGCHIGDESRIAPGLVEYHTLAGERVDGQSAEVYTYNSIVNPADYIVEDYGNNMPNNYGSQLSDQQLADLIAYLLSGNRADDVASDS